MARVFSDVPEKKWQDWQWQLQNRLMKLPDLKKCYPLTGQQVKDIQKVLVSFRMAITPYYLSLIDPQNPDDPVMKQAIPTIHETEFYPTDMDDPLHEEVDSPCPGLTHRYPDRALLLVTHVCSMYCRHCTRRRKVGDNEDRHLPKKQLLAGFDYIRKTPQIRDVILSGGDPFTLTDQEIEWLLSELRKIKHVEIIRIGTRTPVVLPMRITEALCRMIKKYHPVYVNTHFNHFQEINADSKRACEMLADHGIPLGNQSVLLKGVNDNPAVMKKLVCDLLKIRVKPYYIYECDMSRGISHFRTPVATGISIMENLRGHVSGLAVPHFVIDAPGGGGKVPVMPTYIISQGPGTIVLRNYEGKIISCHDRPGEAETEDLPKNLSRYYSMEGVAELLNTQNHALDYGKILKKGPKRGKRK
ncbi:MAG: lysine 2,3-aminomutase [Candidatus Wallbacteria bacterium]|nr:lysine 2,3-aminomutase [Candidatus Wallbacteria bacterium]